MTRTAVISPRQADVLLELLRDGADSETIARRLGMSAGMVRKQLHRIYQATDTAGRTALAVAVLTGVVKPAVRGRDHWSRDNDTRRSA